MVYQIDRSKCLCCHNCALECPKEAISYQGTGYTVNPDLCIGCGKCARLCNVGAAQPVGGEKPAPAHELEELTADLVVLGAGASGVVAAAHAAYLSHKKVILLEKAAKFGGSGWFAGFMVPVAGEKPAQPPMFAQAAKALREGGIDPEIQELAQTAPSDFFQWFRSLDPRVDEYWEPKSGPFGGASMELKQITMYNLKNRDKAIGPGRSTSVMETILVENFPKLGVELRTNHEVVAIEKDAEGKICGVLANNPGGQVHISCKAVISCTGGFAHNDELLRQYAPQFFGPEGSEPTHRFAAPTNTGDVVKLGEGVGAYLDRDNFFANVFGPVHHPFNFSVFKFGLESEVVNVNLEGKRFVDESAFGAGAAYIVKQPGRIAWSIMDADTKELIGARLMSGPDAPVLQGYEADFEEELSLDTPLKKADTLEELAQLCGIAPEAFVETIRQYNGYCDAGKDEDFGKNPATLRPVRKAPFYAIFGKVATDGAFGGMLVNSHMEVYQADKSGVIPGLYAAGDNSSGWALKSKEEGDHRLMVTNECNWAIGSGFVAGKEAAAYLAK
jgi:fumarate reductase flavoprotein subunit